EAAVGKAAAHLGLTLRAPLRPKRADGGPARATLFGDGGISEHDIPARLMYVRLDSGKVHLAWDVVIAPRSGRHWWDLKGDAGTGEVLEQVDWTHYDRYQVSSLPSESPDAGARTVVTDPADAIASPFGWHDTNGAAGAEFNVTRGNNVLAQEDANGNDGNG